ncbi:unnamed protein product [Mycena citricolor]|uniref:Uncharacterized protein n=1 Tax=Mycena citricolor TaxID=2018698 RepID=A0AAD2HE57_9AGAR|nr:unnamed protein product [Mycena citricolor]
MISLAAAARIASAVTIGPVGSFVVANKTISPDGVPRAAVLAGGTFPGPLVHLSYHRHHPVAPPRGSSWVPSDVALRVPKRYPPAGPAGGIWSIWGRGHMRGSAGGGERKYIHVTCLHL